MIRPRQPISPRHVLPLCFMFPIVVLAVDPGNVFEIPRTLALATDPVRYPGSKRQEMGLWFLKTLRRGGIAFGGRWLLWAEISSAYSVLVCLDIFGSGCCLFSGFVGPIWLVLSVLNARVQRAIPRVAAARILVPLVTLLLSLANYFVQNSIATANAASIIRACESYREANGGYPDRLHQLVPRYLNSIPRAKYCWVGGEFAYYRSSPQHHVLWWCKFTPFCKRVYNFERSTWHSID